jgi:quercetin dioxygenase-like cupin family protein
MAIVTPKPFQFGSLIGAIYDFPNVDDILPSHGHNETTAHITIVAKGAVRVITPVLDQVFQSGAVIDLPSLQMHEFIATEDNSRIVNIIKSGCV